MKTILDLDSKQARRFFMESENYCNIDLPPYFDFTPILDFVKSMCGQAKGLEGILKKDTKGKKIAPSQFDDVNHSMLTNKDGRYAFRPLQIANPYNYYFLARTITEKDNWEELMYLFKTTHHVANIEVASIPKVKDYTKDLPRKKYDIDGYIELFEQRAVALSLEYRYIFVTDITNCYGSMYTHSIAWAVNGKEIAKEHRGNDELLGNKIDSQIRWMQYNQTNGIPQGSTLFDFIAEIVLGYADKRLDDELVKQGITEYKVLRYRDDYKIFCKDKQNLEKISYTLQKVLAELNMMLNSSKTKLSEDVITLSYKEDKLANIESSPLYYYKRSLFMTVQKELLYIRHFSKQHPNSGQTQKMLTNLYKRIPKQEAEEMKHKRVKDILLEIAKKLPDSELIQKEITEMQPNRDVEDREHWASVIAILVDIAMDNPKLYSDVVALLSVTLSKFGAKEEQKVLVDNICDKLFVLPNKGILQLWLQRITIPILDEAKDYEEKLCRIVNNVPNIQLWNLSWIDDKFTKDFPLYEIVNDEKLKDLEPIVEMNEYSPFEY